MYRTQLLESTYQRSTVLFILFGISMVAGSPPGLAQLTEDNLLDRLLIEDMMTNFYWELTDYSGDRNHIDQYYLPDAVFVVNGFRMEGREAIKEAYESRQNEAVVDGSKMIMFLDNARINITGDSATFEAIWTGILNKDLHSAP